MAGYTDEQKEKVFALILERVSKGEALRVVLRNPDLPSSITFYKWLDADAELAKRYTRACDERAEAIFEDILDIADDASKDSIDVDLGGGVVVQKTDYENIQRSRLRVDARKWMLAKLKPSKYGDKVEATLKGDASAPITVLNLGSGLSPEAQADLM